MRMGLGVRTGLGHGGITCVLQTQFSSFTITFFEFSENHLLSVSPKRIISIKCTAQFPFVDWAVLISGLTFEEHNF